MELRDLKTFVVVASLLSFNRAGRILGAAQSTVSVRIQALEEELGVRLFDRLGRGVALTEAGERLLEYARKIGELEEEARTGVEGGKLAAGCLTVRVPDSLGVYRIPSVMAEFRRRFPHVRVRFTSCASEGLAADLRKGLTDLAFLLAPGASLNDLQVEFLGVEKLELVVSASHPLAALETVRPQDLEGVDLALSTADCSARLVLEQILAEAGLSARIAVECSSESALVRLVSEGAGVTILSSAAADAWRDRAGLAVLAFSEGPLEAGVLMLTSKGKWLSPALAGFMSLAREKLMSEI